MTTADAAMSSLPAPARMWRAFAERDPAFEGVFLVAVRTTGIFCRPTCPARRPRRENVEFFADAASARAHGFRACKRCRPLEAQLFAPPLVERLRTLVESEPEARIGDKELARIGVEPSTARRQFRKHFGLSFQAWQRAHRLGIALGSVREGARVIEAQQQGGFESGSGFRAAVERHFGAAPSRAARHAGLLARWIETPLGSMLLVADEEGLRLADFVDRRAMEQQVLGLRERLGQPIVPGSNAHLRAAAAQLLEYFRGERREFDLVLKPAGSEFELRVWTALGRIPCGETRSYAEIAAELRRPGAQRAVGTANGRNPLAVVVPCHRVIRSDGSLSGYGGGVWRKRWLLDHEGRARPR